MEVDTRVNLSELSWKMRQLCCGRAEQQYQFSRSERMLAIYMYDLDYIIFDRKTGEHIDCAVEDIDDTTQTIRMVGNQRLEHYMALKNRNA